MSNLSKAHDLAFKLLCELEELKDGAFGPDTTEQLETLYEKADELQSELYDLIEAQL
ncbi:hypothetical protein [Proteiniphilum sp.]|uniref:hypothetical protein n=1 Tax=Proteiniphilum sp. TaxID=1926877 RepID=UPI002B219C72|nr:hypothetical protein [Proteiniphilum sp.]MEA4916316.1 hypothetical protein [Proteiniphilum sp.]